MNRATVQVPGAHTGSEGWNYLADCPSHSVNKGSCVKSFGHNRNGMKNYCKSAVFSWEKNLRGGYNECRDPFGGFEN